MNATLGYALVFLSCAYSALLVGANAWTLWARNAPRPTRPPGHPPAAPRRPSRRRPAAPIAAALFAGLTAAPSARAHFVFILPQADRATARVVLSESLQPDADVDVALIATATLIALDPAGHQTPLDLVQPDPAKPGRTSAGHAFTIALPAATHVVYGLADLGVTQRGHAKPFLLLYYPKAVLGDGLNPAAALGDRAPVEILPIGQPGAVRFELRVAGKPTPAAELTVLLPDGSQQMVTTADDGATPPFTPTGRYGVWARSFITSPGVRAGKPYDQVRRYATLVADIAAPPAPAATAALSTAAPPTAALPPTTQPTPTQPTPTQPTAAPVTAPRPLPHAASSFGAVAADGWLYVYGGHVAPVHTYSTAAVSGQFYRRKIDRDDPWQPLPPGPALQGMNLAACDGKIYRAGGMTPRNRPGEKADNWSTPHAARFDPAAGRWSPLPPLPEPRSSHDLAVVARRLYVVGGWDMRGAAGGNHWLDHALVMDLSAQNPRWDPLPQPFQRRALILASHAGKLYAIGGFDDQSDPSRKVDVFDPATGLWSAGPDLPAPDKNGFSPAACSAAGRLYVSVADGTLLRLSDDSKSWEPVARTTPRIVHRMVPGAPGLLVIGGASAGANLDLIEAVDPNAPAHTPPAPQRTKP